MGGSALAGKTAFVTGGASGIGRSVCERMVAEGARVAVADVNEEAASAVASRLGGGAMAVLIDVSKEADWITGLKEVRSQFGRLDIVANIAGVGVGGTIEEIESDDWERMIAVNLTGAMWGCKHGLKAIVATGGRGAIVNMSSIGGLVGPPDIAGYAASKGGVTVLTKSVALHCAAQRYPVRCVSVHPTYVNSPMLDPVAQEAGTSRAALTEGMAALVPMGRVAEPEDVANVVVFAASDAAAMVSGSAILVDGAQLAGPPAAHFGAAS